MMMSSRMALEELLQNRLTTRIVGCEDPLSARASAADLYRLYAEKQYHVDDASMSSGGADRAIKREALSPTTDQQSEDSGVDVSAHKRRRPDDGLCPIAIKSSRTDAAAAVLSVNVAVQQLVSSDAKAAAASMTSGPPFRPWSVCDESSSDASLRLFHDIRNVDRIRTLTQRPKTPPPEPLDLTSGGRGRAATACSSVPPNAAPACAVPMTVDRAVEASTSTTAAAAKYSKNMSRARRIEANARERSRVHTISAAFDTLRATVPSYSRTQKLSKLSTIRIASAYILTLSRLLDMDYSAEKDGPSVDECVRNVTGIIHTEGKAKKRKDER